PNGPQSRPYDAGQLLFVNDNVKFNPMNIEFTNCANCTCGCTDLYKVKDDIWIQAGVNTTNPCACLNCLENALGRKLVASDFDLEFPWWGTERPDYYEGFRDGLFGYNSPRSETDKSAIQMYSLGQSTTNRYYVNPRDPNNH
ncbi:MAG TPA: hypothetical protein VMM56_17195, partial [Planctomycetaceae bacterium]|nr:hypothetical protein [Planctomycetaceae bacterium]